MLIGIYNFWGQLKNILSGSQDRYSEPQKEKRENADDFYTEKCQNDESSSFSSFTCLTAEEKANAELMTVDFMEGLEFEHWCAHALENMGFTNVCVTPGSGDHGVDVLAEKDGVKYAIQCKRYSGDLGNTPVQEVFAGKNMYNCHVGAVITNQYFTSGAKQLADVTGVLLWDRNWIKSYLLNSFQEGFVPQESKRQYSDMFCKAVEVILETNVASVEMLRKKLNIGYAQAARLIDEMEENGIVGEFRGSKPRDILISKKFWDLRK